MRSEACARAGVLSQHLTAALEDKSAAERKRQMIQLLPKTCLHEHLSGSIRAATLRELCIANKGKPEDIEAALRVIDQPDRSLGDCFAIFDLIHHAVRGLDQVRRVTSEVLEDFAASGCLYLELRTTPRELGGRSKRDYLDAVLQELAAWRGTMLPRMLVSVDRSAGPVQAMGVVQLAVEVAAHSEFIVGVDFSGNPTSGSFAQYLSAFRYARQAGLACAVHCGEVASAADSPQHALRFGADRLGHALMWPHGVTELLASAAQTPIEICPTSNMKTLHLNNLRDHPTLGRLLAANYPLSINCDDCGVFNIDISGEYLLVAEAFGLSVQRLGAIAMAGLDQAFASIEDKIKLKQLFASKIRELLDKPGALELEF